MQADLHILTEIEGAILSEIQHRGQKTAFQVRRAFQMSASIEWSGSAGSVYPAVKRLRSRGLIQAEPVGDRRSTLRLTLTENGALALAAWTADSTRSISVGIDPFRLRAAIWTDLPDAERKRLYEELSEKIRAEIMHLNHLIGEVDEFEARRLRFNIRVQEDRLNWLRLQA